MIEYNFKQLVAIEKIRLVFDSNLSRGHLNMVCNYPLDMPRFEPPGTLVKGFSLEIEDETGRVKEIFRTDNNYQRFFVLEQKIEAVKVRLVINNPGKQKQTGLFAFEVM